MKPADGYRDYAKECLRWAAEAKTEEERQAFLTMAEQWVEAALRAEGSLTPNFMLGPRSTDAWH